MTPLAIVVFAILVGMALVQAMLEIAFVQLFYRAPPPEDKDRTANGNFTSFASVRSGPTALLLFSGGRGSDLMSLKKPNEAEKPTSRQTSARRAYRF